MINCKLKFLGCSFSEARSNLRQLLHELIKTCKLGQFNCVVILNLFYELWLILVTLSNESHSYSICPKTTSTTHSVHKVSIIRFLPLGLILSYWDVIIYNDIDFGYVDTSCQDISADKGQELVLSERIQGLISILLIHVSNQHA